MSGVSAGLGLSALDDWLPLFSGVVAMTSNGVAEISEAGAYAQPTRPGGDVLDVARRVTLRASTALAPQVRLVAAEPGSRTGPGLELVADDEVLHRCVLTRPRDSLLLAEMAATLRSAHVEAPVAHPAWAVSAWTCETSGARCFARLERASRREHVDALLADGGPARHAMLECSRPQLTQCVAIDHVGGLLAQARGYAAPVVAGVVVPGLMQVGAGTVGAVVRRGAALIAEVGAATVAVDLARVTECRVVWPAEGASTVELYDESDRCVALLSVADTACFTARARWDHLVEMACL